MNFLKHLIVKIFRIQIDDLPKKEEVISEISQDTQILINKQINLHLSQIIEEKVIPELRETIIKELENLKSINKITQKDNEKQAFEDQLVEEKEDFEKKTDNNESDEYLTSENYFLEGVDEISASSPISKIDSSEYDIDTELIKAKPRQADIPFLEENQSKTNEHMISIEPTENQNIRLGIDFGTTTTAISIKFGEDLPFAIPIGNDGESLFMPSIVFIQPGEGEILDRAIVGEDAQGFEDQGRIIRSVKRCLGCNGKKCDISKNNDQLSSSSYPFQLCKKDGLIYVSETETVDPSEIAYLIIKEALERAIKVIKDRKGVDLSLKNLSIYPSNFGCGAQFDSLQREIVRDIAKQLGFSNITIENVVEEPILSGFTFSRFAENPKGRSLIYDFGGGTFDTAILEVDRDKDHKLRITVIATAGENWLGGDDIDKLIYDYFISQIAQKLKISHGDLDMYLNGLDKNNLLVLSRNAKELLSEEFEYKDSLFIHDLDPVDIEIKRTVFENILANSKIVDKSIAAVERACKLAYVYEEAKEGLLLNQKNIINHNIQNASKNIDKVILVGGVTKIPFVREKFKEFFDDEKIVGETIIEPISAVAIGAAYPREKQHYSICVPPYGFYLEYCNIDGNNQNETILNPFEYHDFHKFWHISSLSTYNKEIQFDTDRFSARIMAKIIDQNKPIWTNNIGQMKAGDWIFSITPEGIIYFNKKDDKPKSYNDFPFLHPVQIEIRNAREKQEKKEKEERINKTNYDDDLIGWLSDK